MDEELGKQYGYWLIDNVYFRGNYYCWFSCLF